MEDLKKERVELNQKERNFVVYLIQLIIDGIDSHKTYISTFPETEKDILSKGGFLIDDKRYKNSLVLQRDGHDIGCIDFENFSLEEGDETRTKTLLRVTFDMMDTRDDTPELSLSFLFKADATVVSVVNDCLDNEKNSKELLLMYGYENEPLSHKEAIELLKKMVAIQRNTPEMFVGEHY